MFAEMCFGAVFNIIFHIFFIAVGAFGRLYSQEDTETPSKLSLLHLNHFDCFFGGWGGYLLIVAMTFLQSNFDHWLCKLFYISLFFSLFYGFDTFLDFLIHGHVGFSGADQVSRTRLISPNPSQTSSGKNQ